MLVESGDGFRLVTLYFITESIMLKGFQVKPVLTYCNPDKILQKKNEQARNLSWVETFKWKVGSWLRRGLETYD